jgi:hypothetical protein
LRACRIQCLQALPEAYRHCRGSATQALAHAMTQIQQAGGRLRQPGRVGQLSRGAGGHRIQLDREHRRRRIQRAPQSLRAGECRKHRRRCSAAGVAKFCKELVLYVRREMMGDSAATVLCQYARVMLQAEAARESDATAARDGDGEASSSLTVAAAMATEHAEGHGSLQYAAAQPGGPDFR